MIRRRTGQERAFARRRIGGICRRRIVTAGDNARTHQSAKIKNKGKISHTLEYILFMEKLPIVAAFGLPVVALVERKTRRLGHRKMQAFFCGARLTSLWQVLLGRG
jgi:hypothetical protein